MRALPLLARLLLSGLLLAAGGRAGGALDPKCPVHGGGWCWIEFVDQPGCHAWVRSREGDSAHEWSGGCTGGLASGEGILSRGTSEGVIKAVLEGAYVDGKRHGRWIELHAGMTDLEGPYVDGKRHGWWIELHAGMTDLEGPYVDGKRHGRWTIRYAGGIVAEGPLVDGKQHGRWTVSYPGGTVWEGPYVDGERHGPWTERRLDGRCVVVEYARGEEVGRSSC